MEGQENHTIASTETKWVLLWSTRVPQDLMSEVEDGAEETAEQAIERMPAKLYRYPKSLHNLWHKY